MTSRFASLRNTSALALVSLVAASAVARQAAPKPPTRTPLGQFVLENAASINARVQPGNKPVTVIARGPKLRILSPRYDLAAPLVNFKLVAGKVESGTTSGGTRVDVRNVGLDNKTITNSATLTSETSVYTAANGNNLAQLDFPQRVHVIWKDPKVTSANGPLDIISTSARIIFHPDGSYDLELGETNATAEPLEKATEKPTPKKP